MEIAGIIYEMVGMSFAVIVSNVVATALLGAFFLESKKQLIVLFLVFQDLFLTVKHNHLLL